MPSRHIVVRATIEPKAVMTAVKTVYLMGADILMPIETCLCLIARCAILLTSHGCLMNTGVTVSCVTRFLCSFASSKAPVVPGRETIDFDIILNVRKRQRGLVVGG